MNNLPIDRATFEEAKTVLRTTNPFIESLNTLVASNHFTEELDIKMLIAIDDWITAHSNKFKTIYETGLLQYENRPQAHITACFRKHEANQSQINLLNNTSKRLIDRHNEKVLVLQKQGFTELQIIQILPSPEEEVRANAGRLAALTAESKTLWDFTNSAPKFDISQISHLDISGYLEMAESQLKQRAVA
jgi:hypothetical protein